MSSVLARTAEPGAARRSSPTDSSASFVHRSPLRLAAAASLWIAGPGNWPLWQALLMLPESHASLRGLLFLPGLALMIAALSFALLALASWRRVLKPAIALLLLSAALGAHFMGQYGVVIDPTMMANVFGTDPREVRDLVNLPLAWSLLGLAGLPIAWMLRRPLAYGAWPRRLRRNLLAALAGLLAVLMLAIGFYPDLSGTMRNHKQLRYLVNPFNGYYSLGRAAYLDGRAQTQALRPIGLDARPAPPRPGQRPPLLLLVVGETARADHFGLNGYGRDTTPGLAARGVLSFHQVSSCGTNTAASLPCMLSHEGKAAYESHDDRYENLLDLLQRAGLAVLWVENQAGCKGVCERVPHTRPEIAAPGAAAPDARLCPGGECFDEALLTGLDARLAALPVERRERGVVLVLHQIGSHGPAYAARSPADRKPFQPECASTVLHQCPRETLINSYDNSIAYTDRLLSKAIDWLQNMQSGYDTRLLYLSDHGESLGENGLYLHGLPYALAPREQTHVPMVAWLPDRSLHADRLDAACLRARLDTPLTHDHLFHTVLGLARVQASEYRAALDALDPCRAH